MYNSNKTVEEIQQAYKNSCKLTGLQFNHNEDYTGLGLNWRDVEYEERHICTEYESSFISKVALNILIKHGIDHLDESLSDYISEDTFVYVLIEFIKLSLPDLKLTEGSFKKSQLNDIPAINGWWNKKLNVQFGYGLFE